MGTKLGKVQDKIHRKAEKAQRLLAELKQLTDENENLDVIYARKASDAKEMHKLMLQSDYYKKCRAQAEKPCHIRREQIRDIKKNPHKYSLAKYLDAYGLKEYDATYARQRNCENRNKAKQTRCVNRAESRREKARRYIAKWKKANGK